MGLVRDNVAQAIELLDQARALLVGGLPERACENDGKMFVPHHPSARFCSNQCRQAAYRKRKASVPTEIP